MALEKREPLPAGRYWLDVVNENRMLFEAWMGLHNVVLERQEDLETQMGMLSLGQWYLFRLETPAPWGELAKKLGWPNIAGPEVKTKADTAQAPKSEDLPLFAGFEGLEKLADSAKLLLFLGALYLISKHLAKGR